MLDYMTMTIPEKYLYGGWEGFLTTRIHMTFIKFISKASQHFSLFFL